jgi:purine nucleosidase
MSVIVHPLSFNDETQVRVSTLLLTALQSSFEPDPSSSTYVLKPALTRTAQGTYQLNPAGRTIRVYQELDTNLFQDFFAKLELLLH